MPRHIRHPCKIRIPWPHTLSGTKKAGWLGLSLYCESAGVSRTVTTCRRRKLTLLGPPGAAPPAPFSEVRVRRGRRVPRAARSPPERPAITERRRATIYAETFTALQQRAPFMPPFPGTSGAPANDCHQLVQTAAAIPDLLVPWPVYCRPGRRSPATASTATPLNCTQHAPGRNAPPRRALCDDHSDATAAGRT